MSPIIQHLAVITPSIPNIVNTTEQAEKKYLDLILHQLDWSLEQIHHENTRFSKEFREEQRYQYDQRSGMDEADIVSAGQSHKRFAFQGKAGIEAQRKLIKLKETPYFGRIDFARDGQLRRIPIYIGIHSFIPQQPKTYPIYDWRTPVASMFYDFELGEAWYHTPKGKVFGNIELRRQYRIRRGKMEYMLENAVNIQDEVLQKELSHTSDDKMKNIVATIQRDQNAIIRNEVSPVLIIQGVAGSGKTSIAIHRMAFLLYRFRDELKSSDILIVSPNKVFADYISNVLPELGEANIPELGMDELAEDLLDHQFRFQTFFQQLTSTLNHQDQPFLKRLQFKSTSEFVSALNRYFIHLENHWFTATDIRVGGITISESFIKEKFHALQRVPLLIRVSQVAKEVQHHLRNTLNRKLSGSEKSQIYQAISSNNRKASPIDLYRDFFKWLGREALFQMSGNKLEYADVFPLIYCKIRLEGMEPYHHIKHLVVDEMQDYTPIQYTVLSYLFHCNKTILGDASQAVNPYGSSAGEIEKIFHDAEVIKLHQSYRSTWEITQFSLSIKSNPDLKAVERHGPTPEVISTTKPEEEVVEIRKKIDRFRSSDHQMMAILCKTQKQAKSLYAKLNATGIDLLTEESTYFSEGVLITTIFLAKGLEFDEVIVPFASADHYHTESDRSLLYVACTRAMHRLTVTFTGKRSPSLMK